MHLTTPRARYASLAMTLMFAFSLLIGLGQPQLAWSQNNPKHTHHKNFAQRHPTLTSAAAGYAAYKVAKTTGRNRAAHGGHKNFAQRHPFLTGVAAAGVTHHYIKKSMKHHNGQ